MRNDIVLIGRPGSGKSTVGKALAQYYGMEYISSGDIARKIAEHDKVAEERLNNGHLAPEFLMRNKLEHTARIAYVNGKSVIFDGFPRFIDQDGYLIRHISPFPLYVHIDVSRDIAVERLLNRHRDDDNIDIISHRMKFFQLRTLPILNLHHTDHIEIDGDGDINVVIENTIKEIDKYVNSSKA